MNKFIFTLATLAVLTACSDDTKNEMDPQAESANQKVASRTCASDEVLKLQLSENPNLASKMADIEAHAQNFEKMQGKLVNGTIVIPVVVNVLYKTAAENISLAQIQSQIDVLNKDFNAQNADFSQVPALFSNVKANVGIKFELETVNRKQTTKTSWGTNDAMKKSTGILPTSPTTKLNLWVCTIGSGILGYAQFPGGSSATDGVVIDSRYFGNTGTATYPFNLGRTATHEVGHWMNLRHIWGDGGGCLTDYVDDTPYHNAPNYGVPAYPHYSTCSGSPVEMTMNYMDYSDDRGLYMFSEGQKSRMLSIFSPGGARYSFAQ
ncbi:zinc metalloprotease [Empedobacter brevis NBRC 14943 = ATCC 43319]|uniref:Zinc metalloprotease n=1 Tax=Empedobacter brevis NBRC 14943 = ATCC 43319 TaxID=1218108 RepID=A0A511NFW8_9FLAO|nr:zinc metalloprotease [Empedobacter brevis]GEM51712.1 zinc metalloprotease [Empedobacter brevis NBRC 14943 = ATCC 43319]